MFVVVFTLAFGVLWEVLEFVGRRVAIATGNDPVLVQYGLDDAMLDLVFDVGGAVAFALLGPRQWSGVVDSLIDRLGDSRTSGD